MKCLWTQDAALLVEDLVPHAGPFPSTTCTSLGVYRAGELIAGFVFHNYDPKAGLIEVSGASTRPGAWGSRHVVNVAMNYVFDTCGCQMLYARQHIENEAARQGWKRLGADEVVIPRLMGRDTVGTLLTLTDDQWMASKYRRE